MHDNGTATLHTREATIGLSTCRDGLYIAFDDLLLIDLYGEAMLAGQRAVGDRSIELTNAYSMQSILTPVTAVPAEFDYERLEVIHSIRELPVQQHYATGLVYVNGWLWFSDSAGVVHAVNPETGAEETSIELGSFAYVHAAQADIFWMTCYCASDYLRRFDSGEQLVGTVDAEGEFEVEPECIAFDTANEILFVNTYRQATGKFSIIQFNAEVEPDVLVSEVPFIAVKSMSHHNGRLWVLTYDGQVALIDPATGQPLRSFRSVGINGGWRGMAVTDESIFLLGKNNNGKTEIIEVRPAQ